MNVIKSIRITRQEWGVNKDKLTGEMEVTNQHGGITINLDAAKCERIVMLMAEALIETAQGTANMMVENILAQQVNAPAMLEASRE
jgi:hypothetical protein